MANAAVSGARAVQLPQLNANYNQVRERFSENYIYPPPRRLDANRCKPAIESGF